MVYHGLLFKILGALGVAQNGIVEQHCLIVLTLFSFSCL
jgi:hypothetical protein